MNKIKIIIGIVVGIIIVSGISVYATVNVLASDVEYTKKDGTKVSVQEALNELYDEKKDLKIITGTNNRDSGVEQIVIDRDCDNALIISGQVSLEYAINQTDNFSNVIALGHNENAIGFYYSDNISLKKGDIVYVRRDTLGEFGYAIIY